MKRLSHFELAEAQARGRWDVLWRAAIPLVKLTIGRLHRAKALGSHGVDDDLFQEAMLIAGRVMRGWDPLACAYSTHITNGVRWGLLEFKGLRRNGGIGSHVQHPVVLSLGDTREAASFASVIAADYDGDDDGDGATFDAALTYDGVVRPGGQFDGLGFVPQGFGDPGDEADRAHCESSLHQAISTLRADERDAICAVYGIGRPPISRDEYAATTGVPVRTLERRLSDAKQLLAVRLPNFYHLGYGSEENVRDA